VILIPIFQLSTLLFSFFTRVCLFVICFRLSDRQLGFHWTEIGEIWYWVFYDNLSRYPCFFKSVKNIGQFTWRPKCFLLLAATLNRRKTLSPSEMASGCHYSPGDVNSSKRFISASVLKRIHFSVHRAEHLFFTAQCLGLQYKEKCSVSMETVFSLTAILTSHFFRHKLEWKGC
jgi:hypothetical protein